LGVNAIRIFAPSIGSSTGRRGRPGPWRVSADPACKTSGAPVVIGLDDTIERRWGHSALAFIAHQIMEAER
jgi:hypothetical protein